MKTTNESKPIFFGVFSDELPKIGKTYNCFNDGKISFSRLYTVDVKEIIPFDKIDKKTLKLWKNEVKDCPWLYSEETDFFIKTDNEETETEFFVRTKKPGWFSIGDDLYNGRLDVDGKLTELLNNI